jgi:hypothetical protein
MRQGHFLRLKFSVKMMRQHGSPILDRFAIAENAPLVLGVR